MASEQDFEPMDQDGDDGGETELQVEVTNDLFKNNNENEEILDFEADDLEVTDFLKSSDKIKDNLQTEESSENKSNEGDNSAKEDGEISEAQSNDEDDNSQHLSRSSSVRSSRRRNDVRRERSPVARRYPNPYFELDDEKIQSRAVRFGLSTASAAVNVPMDSTQISEEDLLNLYISCGLIQDDGGKLSLDKVIPHYRLDSVLIRGTNHMNTNEIFKYLYDLGHKPESMEWVNDAMCVVIYKDQFDAATSLMKASKPIQMDPRIVERKRSLVQASGEPEKDDNAEEKSENMSEDIDYDKVDAVPQSWITVPMPPGYVWRFGAPCEKAKGILVRYATKQDKKQERAERFSEYYQKYGNPNKTGPNRENNGTRENLRRRKKVKSEMFDGDRREKEDASYRESQMKTVNPNDKNGWGQLSAMWDDEEAFQRSARDRITTARQRSKDDTGISGVSPLKRSESLKAKEGKVSDARELLKTRQKRKRGSNSSDEDGETESDYGDNDGFVVTDRKDGSHRRKRNSKYNDDEDDDGDMAWKERLTGPRMRMHADEEEERMKRRAYRRLGQQKRVSDTSLQTNPWEFSRESSSNSSFRSKNAPRRPISERLGAKRSGVTQDNPRGDETSEGGFDLRQKLISMRRTGDEQESSDAEEDLHNLIFYGND